MSLKQMNWVWETSPYKDATLILHLALADFSHDDGYCYGHYGTLAKKARCSNETVRRSLAKMVQDGFLEVLSAPKQGRGSPPGKYRLLDPAKHQDLGVCAPEDDPNTSSTDANTTTARNTPIEETINKRSPSSASTSSSGEEPTVGQRANAIARGFYDWIVEQSGMKPTAWKVPQLIKLVAPFLENGWPDGDVKRVLAQIHTSGHPLNMQVIERNLRGIRPGGPPSKGAATMDLLARAARGELR